MLRVRRIEPGGCLRVTQSLAMAMVLFTTTAHAQLPAKSTDTPLQQRLQSMVKAHDGGVSLYARQLNSERSVEVDASRPVQTASVIKLAILYEAMEQVRAGQIHWEDRIALKAGDAVNGSGLLQFLDAPTTLTLKDVLTMMIVVSDNTATNLAIDRLGIRAIDDRLVQLGLANTYLYKKIGKPATAPMPADQKRFGLGKTTAAEMERLMERIALCQLDAVPRAESLTSVSEKDAAICSVALTMLRNQFYREMIPRYFDTLDSTETSVGIANKTGSLDAVRNDVAVITGKSGPIILSIFTYGNTDQGWSVDNSAELLVAKLAREIVTAWSPEGIDGKTLVPGLGIVPQDADHGAAEDQQPSKR